MCKFFSGVVVRNGDVLSHPMLDNHHDIVRYFGLPDTMVNHRHFAKVELHPKDWLDVSTWEFVVDEPTKPDWLEDIQPSVEDTMRRIAKKMILTEKTKIPTMILDGCWIIGGSAVVKDVRGGRIIRVQDSAQISDVMGSARISGVMGSVQISGVRGSAQISDVGGSAKLDESAETHCKIRYSK